jgi:hypothetical protein
MRGLAGFNKRIRFHGLHLVRQSEFPNISVPYFIRSLLCVQVNLRRLADKLTESLNRLIFLARLEPHVGVVNLTN